jgi:hypothetical protein
MSITVELSPEEIRLIKQLTNAANETEAVSMAAREFLRLIRLRELKSVSGKVDYVSNWEELEAAEIAEQSFPQ